MIKHIFTDMDGTLLNPAGQISAATCQAIHQVGLPVTLVSARSAVDMVPFATQLHLTGPQIGFNGALIYQLHHHQIHPLHTIPLAANSALQIIQAVQRHFPAVSINLYDPFRWYAPQADRGVARQAARSAAAPTITPVEPLLSQADFNLIKVTLIMEAPQKPAPVVKLIAGLGLTDVSLQIPASEQGVSFIDITSRQANKAHGVQTIMAEAGLRRAETAAFGDGENDLPMLAAVGLPIAMGNASAKVQAAAKYVTKPNTADGWAHAVLTHPAFQNN